jgi:hypothetical protein
MRNYVDLYERATFFPRGSHEDKFLGDWLKFMMKTGSEQWFPNTAIASNAIETARILMRSRQGSVKLVQWVIWDQIRSAYLKTGGAGSENVSETLNLLSDAKPVRVFMAQTLQPLADRSGRDGAAQDGRQGNNDEMSGTQAKQELAEARNTITQPRKYQVQFKKQRREGWNSSSDNGLDSHGHEQHEAGRT